MGRLAVEDSIERLLAARDDAEDDLLSDQAMAFSLAAESGTDGYGFENIVGVGIAERLTNGHPIGQPAVTVYVARKAPPDEVVGAALVPPEYEGVPTDVVESGEFVAFTERGRYRPAPSGVSVGHHSEDAGTLGFLASHQGEFVLVSNNHVLALTNDAAPGDAIVQPGHADGGSDSDRIGTLKRFHPLDFAGRNMIDAAIATVERDMVSSEIYGIGAYSAQPLEAQEQMLVRKVGRTSGVSRGIVRDIHASIKLRYRPGVARLQEQVIVEPRDAQAFSEAGDSGSLVIEESSRCPIGLLCGGTPGYSVVNRIDRVLDGLGLSLST
ncbi:MAG: hypothetical protein JWO74_3446 [Solirubrobacterales bacterium]|nr:hypothetical protein [Solirubrobacterales bacterium]